MEPSSLLLRTTWNRDSSFWDIPSTSPTIFSTIHILPRPIKLGSFVIPKSCHHHEIRPLTYIFALNPNTLSGNSYHFVNLSQKFSAPCLPLFLRDVTCSHYLSLVIHKRCHRLCPLVHKCFLLEPLCHRRRKAVP